MPAWNNKNEDQRRAVQMDQLAATQSNTNKSFAEAIDIKNFTAKVDTVQEHYNDMVTLAESIQQLNAICNIKKMIQMVQSLQAALQNCNTPAQQLLIFLDIFDTERTEKLKTRVVAYSS